MNLEEFGIYFKEQRVASGYKSQRQLAIESGISNGTIARIEAGTQKATMDTLRILSKYIKTASYGELVEKAGYLDGLTDEKKHQMKEVYDDHLKFTEEFSELISKMSSNGEFFDYLKQDIVNSLERYVDEDFSFTPKELIDLFYDKGDFSDMGDLYATTMDIALKHNILPNKAVVLEKEDDKDYLEKIYKEYQEQMQLHDPDGKRRRYEEQLQNMRYFDIHYLLKHREKTFYNGCPLTDQDRQLITAYLDILFMDRIKEDHQVSRVNEEVKDLISILQKANGEILISSEESGSSGRNKLVFPLQSGD